MSQYCLHIQRTDDREGGTVSQQLPHQQTPVLMAGVLTVKGVRNESLPLREKTRRDGTVYWVAWFQHPYALIKAHRTDEKCSFSDGIYCCRDAEAERRYTDGAS